jgi:hypothetical protein
MTEMASPVQKRMEGYDLIPEVSGRPGAFYRYWRLAEASYIPPPRRGLVLSDKDRGFWAEQAERRLRKRVGGGATPEIVFVSPHQSTRVMPNVLGVWPPLYAWTAVDREPEQVAAILSVHSRLWVLGQYLSSKWEPDAEKFAASLGSVRIFRSELTFLQVPAWARPIAQQLANQFGVEVMIRHV